MSEKRLAEIRERLEKATPGPWVNEGDVVADEQSIVVGVESYNWRFIAHINSDTDDGPETPPISPEEAKANAEFIANAPTDIAFLLDDIYSLRRQLETCQENENDYDKLHDYLGDLTTENQKLRDELALLKPGEREK